MLNTGRCPIDTLCITEKCKTTIPYIYYCNYFITFYTNKKYLVHLLLTDLIINALFFSFYKPNIEHCVSGESSCKHGRK